MDYIELFKWVDQFGIYDSLMPFILIFLLVYAVLSSTRIFDDKKQINIVIALIMGCVTVIPHLTNTYPASVDPVDFINKFLPNVALFVVIFFLMQLIGSLFGLKGSDFTKSNYSLFTLIIITMTMNFLYPSVSDFFTIIALFLLIHSILFSPGPGVTAPILVATTALLVYFTVTIIAQPGPPPDWMTFTLDSNTKIFIYILFSFFIVVRLITTEKGEGGIFGRPKKEMIK
ncbi:hypothetical protein K9M79_04280 [Candidatus Woesearchaeota archaeon]|nr:hypothetical protein [Candidatus Woesearchaeota archaeon]